jgi:hypothetical protein
VSTAGIRFPHRRPVELLHPRQVDIQHLAIEVEERRQRLAMRRRRNMAIVGEMGEEALDLDRPHLPGMAQSVPADERLHPVDVGLLRS